MHLDFFFKVKEKNTQIRRVNIFLLFKFLVYFKFSNGVFILEEHQPSIE